MFSFPWSVPPVDGGKLAAIQAEFTQHWLHLAEQWRQGTLPPSRDRRFRDPAWAAHPTYLFAAHAYLLSAQALNSMVEASNLDEPARERLRFAVMQWVEAMSPANFLATNPEAQQAVIDSGGESLQRGMQNFLADVRKGRLTQTDESRFEVGGNLAITPGDVVYENAVMQLIQYRPATTQTWSRPLVIVPPCINKYYILDLQPENSFVRHAVEAGHTVFMVSWRNPLPADDDGSDRATWDDYVLSGVRTALAVASDISGQPQVNALGFCVGGTLLAVALAHAHALGERPVASLTLLTTLLDFADTGVLGMFVDENHARLREQQLGHGGLMPAQELATTFSFLRPGELVWNYVVGNYLKGDTPPAFDLLYWNADGTNLPGPFFSWYLRHTYLQNDLARPGAVAVGGVPIDFGQLDLPAYVYGSREDHIVPWTSAYASVRLLTGTQPRFVLGASGHIAGVINPPAAGRRSHWTRSDSESPLPAQPGEWLTQATEQAGSWWPDWLNWLEQHAGKRTRARRKPGNARHAAIEPAPGRYAQVRAV